MYNPLEHKPGEHAPGGGDWTEVNPHGGTVNLDVHVPPGHRFPPTPNPHEGFVPEKPKTK